MPPAPSSIKNAYKRSDVYRKQKKDKAKAKLQRRLDTKKAETSTLDGEEIRQARLAANVPRTIDNTREYGMSYLTSNPEASTSAQPVASTSTSPPSEGETGPSDFPSLDEENDNDGGIGAIPSSRGDRDPRILLTTSAKATRETYTFAEELRGIFPGGEFFKRLPGKGFELGRISRWASQRGFDAVIVINEDRKIPNALTIINLPVGPTAYFKLTSIELSKQISGHARPTPHSPELILNNFQTRLGLSVGKLFGSLFPPLPQFEGRQVVTFHNQRDFLFFRRHRYMFKSIEKTALQEIGPRFTLKLRWLRKGLPAVTGGGSVAKEPVAAGESEDEDEEIAPTTEKAPVEDSDDDEEEGQEDNGEDDEDEDDEPSTKKSRKGEEVPPLSQQGEFEWKWKPKLEVSRKTFFL